ncbi:MAG: lysophospholipid acyltransferase family protein [Flavobacteriaceae bacterium]
MITHKYFPTKYTIRFLVWIVFTVFVKLFRIKKNMPNEIKLLKPPYLLLGNHVGYWDAFIIGHFLPHFTHFISSDATFRQPFMHFFLTRLGTIPVKKNTRDTQVVRDMISVINQGENIGIFPEALRSWTGSSFKMDASIAKFIKLLNVPVVVATAKGMSLFNPRWSTKFRFTKVVIDYNLVFTKNVLQDMSNQDIYIKLNKAFHHDEVAYQQKKMNKIRSNHKAEHISYVLYLCPNCQSIDSFKASGNTFSCTHCKYDIHINSFGFFERMSDGKLFFSNIRDWYSWEEKYLLNHVNKMFDNKENSCIFEDSHSKFYRSNAKGKMVFIDTVNLKLFIDRIEIEQLSKSRTITFNLIDLQTINPQINERLEVYYADEAYRFVGREPGVSGLKWEVAVNALWKKTGQTHKLSVYIAQNLEE